MCIAHNTQTTIDIRMHEWFKSDAHSLSPLSSVFIPAYTPPYTQTTIDINMHALFTSDVGCSSSQSKIYIPTYAYNIQTSRATRMHA